MGANRGLTISFYESDKIDPADVEVPITSSGAAISFDMYISIPRMRSTESERTTKQSSKGQTISTVSGSGIWGS